MPTKTQQAVLRAPTAKEKFLGYLEDASEWLTRPIAGAPNPVGILASQLGRLDPTTLLDELRQSGTQDRAMARIMALPPVQRRQAFVDAVTAGEIPVTASTVPNSTSSKLTAYNPAAAAKTAVATTGGTYDKAYALLQDLIGKAQPRILDYGAGRGHGSLKYGLESFEPFVESFTPTYRNIEDIPRQSYEGLLNLNVLNVLPPDLRREAVETMTDTLRPGGYGIISVRGRDVLDALKNPASQAMDEPMSLLTSKGTYQKGFTQPELLEYLRTLLGRGVDVSSAPLNTPASALLRKK